MADKTTILIEKEIRDALNKCKKYPRETYNDTLKRLIRDKKRVSK